MKVTKLLVTLIILAILAYFTQSYWMPLLNPVQEIQEEIIEEEIVEEIPALSCITITAPQANQTVSFPLTVTANIDYGCWTIFEGQAGVVELIQNNQVASTMGFLTVDGDYYEESNYPVTAQAIIESSTASAGAAELVITPENPCGNDPECPAVPAPIIIPVVVQ